MNLVSTPPRQCLNSLSVPDIMALGLCGLRGRSGQDLESLAKRRKLMEGFIQTIGRRPVSQKVRFWGEVGLGGSPAVGLG